MQCGITKGGNKSFNICNVHRFVIGDQGQQASTAPLCIQSCYSAAGAARLMHLFSIYLRSDTQKTALQRHTFKHVPSRSRPARRVCQLLCLTHLLLWNYCKSGRDSVAVVIPCVSQHHTVWSFFWPKRWDSITCCWDFSVFWSQYLAWPLCPLPPPSPPLFPALCCCQRWERRVRSKHASAGRLSWTPGAAMEKGWNP